ncbi:hypothetical protein AMECASPLE_036166 [Ameca splendens]|uniref:Uncharacterized protein n=1 Tax=Ameca splendens TaxID=208324 RepID=A0ABV0XWE8_9TELE
MSRGGPGDDPRWRHHVSRLAPECPRVPPEELEEVSRDNEYKHYNESFNASLVKVNLLDFFFLHSDKNSESYSAGDDMEKNNNNLDSFAKQDQHTCSPIF